MKSLLNQQQLDAIFTHLSEYGLVLSTAIGVKQLPDDIWLQSATPRKKTGTLLLIAHGGRSFWQAYKNTAPYHVDPIDHFSALTSETALQAHLPDIKREILFPAPDCAVNLMLLGRVLGWHTPSPLGMGINPHYGMWSAYRALWWLDAEVETVQLPQPHDVCSECTSQACLQACPAQALTFGTTPDLQECADFRLEPDSACAATCLARMACPVAEAHRYTDEQMAYHYDLGRSQIQLFSSKHNKHP